MLQLVGLYLNHLKFLICRAQYLEVAVLLLTHWVWSTKVMDGSLYDSRLKNLVGSGLVWQANEQSRVSASEVI
jgi:hypothetical protein